MLNKACIAGVESFLKDSTCLLKHQLKWRAIHNVGINTLGGWNLDYRVFVVSCEVGSVIFGS